MNVNEEPETPSAGQVDEPERTIANSATAPSRRKRIALIGAICGLALIGLVTAAAFSPLLDGDLSSHPASSSTNAAALKARLLSADGSEINPECRSIIIDSGRKEARSVVLLHGFTSCPAQIGRASCRERV